MPKSANRRLALFALVTGLLGCLAASGIWWARPWQPADPLAAGHAAYARGDWETASVAARERLRQDNDDSSAIRLLARSLVKLGRDSSAMTMFDRLGPQGMQPDDLYLLGMTFARAGNAKGAIEVWEQALKAAPDHPEVLYEVSRFHLENERTLKATNAAVRLAKQPAWEARANVLLGKAALAWDEPAKAADYWEHAIKVGTSGRTSSGKLDKAAINASVTARKALTRALLQAQQPARARVQIEAIQALGADPETSWLLSRVYLQEGSTEKALEVLKQAPTFADDNPTLPDPAPFVGAESCAPCHSEKLRAQQGSRHARTFHRAAELHDFVPPPSPFPDPAEPTVKHTLRKAGDQIEQETRTSVPEHVFQAVIDYAFGSGDRGKTLVGHDESGTMFELRLSVYDEKSSNPVWDVTSGHPPHPAYPREFLGMYLGEDEVRRCFSCHVTSPRAVIERSGPVAADHSIGCERCHGPGGNHILAINAKFPEPAIARPSLASGASVVKICAQCHSPRGKPVEPNDPTSVRSQGTTLTWSRCYTESNDKLDCVTCHDPHRNVETSVSHYEVKCLACHSGRQGTAGATAASGQRLRRFDLSETPRGSSCPVNPATGCIGCHMPTVTDAIPHSPFTDHFIRVHPKSSVGGGH